MAKIKHFHANALTISALSLLFAATVCAEANAPTWTTKETEQFWASVIANANRVEITPRLKEANSEKGEGILEAFGTQYMPNAYEYYEKARATAIERGQTLKENFPEGEKSDATGGTLYKKVGKATAKAVAEYFRRRDELCHFYLMHKAGLMTDAELAEIDSAKISIMLFAVGKIPSDLPTSTKEPTPGELDFARKYKPETFAAYEREKAIFDEGLKDYASLCDDALILDAARAGTFLVPFRLRLDELGELLSQVAKKMKEEKLLHDVDEITAEQLAASDAEFGRKARALEKTFDVNGYVKGWFANNWTQEEWVTESFRNGMIGLLPFTMVKIPEKTFAICKYEVTQALWENVMGENPSKSQSPEKPVDYVSWKECEAFLEKLNAIEEVKSSGWKYRMPTVEEWAEACLAGSKGRYCRLADGTDISYKTLEEVAWFGVHDNSKTHPVGLKRPNAFGLYDMHGNVAEFARGKRSVNVGSDTRSSFYVSCGGASYSSDQGCACEEDVRNFKGSSYQYFRAVYGYPSRHLGFRLAANRALTLEESQAEDAAKVVERANRDAIEKAKGEEQAIVQKAMQDLPGNMVEIPGLRGVFICKYEVTQALWLAVMGEKPSTFDGYDYPVRKITLEERGRFIDKLNSLPLMRGAGFKFRLPNPEEWMRACLGGAKGKFCKLQNGGEITEITLDKVAWHKDNSSRKPHPVGQKEPNAFGLYDMLGNVREFSAKYDANVYFHGGSFNIETEKCNASIYWQSLRNDYAPRLDVGLRLAADLVR